MLSILFEAQIQRARACDSANLFPPIKQGAPASLTREAPAILCRTGIPVWVLSFSWCCPECASAWLRLGEPPRTLPQAALGLHLVPPVSLRPEAEGDDHPVVVCVLSRDYAMPGEDRLICLQHVGDVDLHSNMNAI